MLKALVEPEVEASPTDPLLLRIRAFRNVAKIVVESCGTDKVPPFWCEVD